VKKLKTKPLIIIAVLAACLIVTTTWGVILTLNPRSREKTLPMSGVIAIGDFGIYWEANCSTHVTSINWGTIEAGANSSVTVYVQHEGTVPFTLYYVLSGWNPVNTSEFITLGWDYDNATINTDDVIPITLTLNVSPLTTGIAEFAFYITIFSA